MTVPTQAMMTEAMKMAHTKLPKGVRLFVSASYLNPINGQAESLIASEMSAGACEELLTEALAASRRARQAPEVTP